MPGDSCDTVPEKKGSFPGNCSNVHRQDDHDKGRSKWSLIWIFFFPTSFLVLLFQLFYNILMCILSCQYPEKSQEFIKNLWSWNSQVIDDNGLINIPAFTACDVMGLKNGRMVQWNVSSMKNRQKFSMKRALKSKTAH